MYNVPIGSCRMNSGTADWISGEKTLGSRSGRSVNVTTERRSVENLVIGLSPVQGAANLNFYAHYDAVLHTQHHRADRPGRATHRVLIQKSQTAATAASRLLPYPG